MVRSAGAVLFTRVGETESRKNCNKNVTTPLVRQIRLRGKQRGLSGISCESQIGHPPDPSMHTFRDFHFVRQIASKHLGASSEERPFE